MKSFFKFVIIFLFFCASKSAFSPHHNLKDLLKDFAKGPEAYLEKVGAKIKAQVLKEMLKFSLADFLNSASSAPLNATHTDFQNVVPFLRFFRLMNLTNHTVDELEKLIIESIPGEYNASNLHALASNKTHWDDFAEKFMKNVLLRFTHNVTSLDFIDHIYAKLKTYHKASNSTSNLTETLDLLGAISSEVLENRNTLTDLAKNIHNQMKDQKTTEAQVREAKSQGEQASHVVLIGFLVLFSVAFLVVLGFVLRRFLRKKYRGHYSQMEAASGLTA